MFGRRNDQPIHPPGPGPFQNSRTFLQSRPAGGYIVHQADFLALKPVIAADRKRSLHIPAALGGRQVPLVRRITHPDQVPEDRKAGFHRFCE